jgi:hypothetical protein
VKKPTRGPKNALGGAAPSSTPIADAAQTAKDAADALTADAQKLQTATTAFDQKAQEHSIAACLKNL